MNNQLLWDKFPRKDFNRLMQYAKNGFKNEIGNDFLGYIEIGSVKIDFVYRCDDFGLSVDFYALENSNYNFTKSGKPYDFIGGFDIYKQTVLRFANYKKFKQVLSDMILNFISLNDILRIQSHVPYDDWGED